MKKAILFFLMLALLLTLASGITVFASDTSDVGDNVMQDVFDGDDTTEGDSTNEGEGDSMYAPDGTEATLPSDKVVAEESTTATTQPAYRMIIGVVVIIVCVLLLLAALGVGIVLVVALLGFLIGKVCSRKRSKETH